MTNKDNLFLFVLISILFVALSVLVFTVNTRINDLSKQNHDIKIYLKGIINDIVSYQLYDEENYRKTTTQGVYFSQGYYCVATEGRDWQDIKMTDYHEMCHAFVSMDKPHFCNNTNQTNRNIEKFIKSGNN